MQHASRRPRTVLFLHGSSGGYGADRQLVLLASRLDRRRYRPLVLLPERGELAEPLEAAGVEIAIAPLAVLRRRLLNGRGVARTAALLARNAREVGELARARRASIVHTNTSLVLCGQAVAERSSAAHLLHVREIYRGRDGARSRLWPALRRRLLRADALACVSRAAAAQFDGAEHVFVLPDGLTRPPPPMSRRDAREALGLDASTFVVTAIGRISDWKGQDVLVRALAHPLLAAIDAVGLVAGDSAEHQNGFERSLAQLTRSLSVDGRVRLLGFRDDVDVLLAASDAVAVPSTYPDSLPGSALEAAAAGVPVVATDVGGLPEIVRDGVTGRIVRSGEPEALARALRELADDPAARHRLGHAAADDAKARFDGGAVVAELEERYDRLLAARRVGPRAWLLPVKRLPVPQPAAPDVRLAREKAWLRELGYDPVIVGRRGITSAPGLVARAALERPALVLAAAAVHAPLLAAIKLLLGRRTWAVADIIGLHSLEIDQAIRRASVRSVLRPVWWTLEWTLTRSADVVLAVNDRHAEIVRRRYRRGGVYTLRDAAETEAAVIAPVRRAELGIPPDAVAVGFAGSLVYSRLELLLSVWERVAAGFPSVCLVVVGAGPDLERYKRTAAGLHAGSFHFLGAVPRREALGVLRTCDIAYSDCWMDAGFPAKLFEYMALGLPIVTAGTPQASEVFEDEETALLYRTPDELVERLRRLLGDPALRMRLGEAGRRVHNASHTVERRQLEFEAVLDRGDGTPLLPRRVRLART
jgi:glycosyltransferase involved in cell wall biosynthesis